MKNTLQLYSLATPNGQKVSICLEEMGLDYEAHTINILKNEQFTDEYKQINPNSKIPALIDPAGPEGKKITLMESGAILQYLAEKTGMFLPKETQARFEVMQWLFFQMAGVGPMFGQFGHFYKYAKDQCNHPYPVERYSKEVKRLLSVIDKQLSSHSYIANDNISIADFSIYPWLKALDQFYEAQEHLNLNEYKYISSWFNELSERPKLKKGLNVCPFPE
ncbi:glutathione S-transferase N-terminal domain-containing protein [bacterium]|nr:glutathione S-transferase N-terminal domain-containing protein [bacterium]